MSNIFHQVVAEIALADKPVAKALRHGNDFKVLLFGFKAGNMLRDHTAHLPSKLYVLKGKVQYNEEGHTRMLGQYDETEIPQNVVHNVFAHEDSLCLLVQGGA